MKFSSELMVVEGDVGWECGKSMARFPSTNVQSNILEDEH